MNNQLSSNYVVTDFPIEMPDKIPEKFYSTNYKAPNVNPTPSVISPSSVPSKSPVNTTSSDVIKTVTNNSSSNKTKYILMAVGAIATGALLYLGYTQRKKIMSSIKSLLGFNKQIETLPKSINTQAKLEHFVKLPVTHSDLANQLKKDLSKDNCNPRSCELVLENNTESKEVEQNKLVEEEEVDLEDADDNEDIVENETQNNQQVELEEEEDDDDEDEDEDEDDDDEESEYEYEEVEVEVTDSEEEDSDLDAIDLADNAETV